MRPIKRARRPVRRYKSLLFPGIAVLAVLAFYAAFVRPEPRRGETARFEQDGLCLEIAGVHHIGGFLGNFDPERGVGVPFDTYYVYPGSAVTVLAAPGEGARWGLRWGEDGRRPWRTAWGRWSSPKIWTARPCTTGTPG